MKLKKFRINLIPQLNGADTCLKYSLLSEQIFQIVFFHSLGPVMYNIKDVHTALDNGKFFLEYMPTISLPDKRCVGAEALIRWQNGETVTYPSEFIPAIENTPLSGLITYWIIETVSKELRSWLVEQDAVHISINTPPEVIGRGGIYYAVKSSRLDVVSDKIMFEVTERGVMDALGVCAVNMAAEHNLLIALDDIAVNDASLLLLSRVLANVVKLDKTLADEMLQPGWTDQKIAGIAALIRCGELRVIAEGVETAEQVEILMNAGIQMAQGWYFSRSLRAADFKTYFAQNQ
jgi:sensor c-di-GMP phosphodiesterase-like protein